MTTAADEARADMVRYHKALITSRTTEAIAIEQRYGLYGLPPQLVSLGLQAASRGLDPSEAVQESMEGSD